MNESGNPSEPVTDPPAKTPGHEDQRRGFLTKFAAAAFGGLTVAIPAFFAGGFFVSPLLKKKGAKDEFDGYYFVGALSNLSPGGAPQAFKITGTKKDAWTTFGEAALGSVYVHMGPGGELTAFNATCTHLGCKVDYKPDTDVYLCPCHDSSFNLDGERNNEIPPRPMDSLDVEVRNEDQIWVKFENFRAGTSKKIPV